MEIVSLAVLIYQLIIIFSLVFVKSLSEKHLTTACLVWTALTLVNVFFPPLIILQLCVVWCTYFFLANEGQKPEKMKPSSHASATASENVKHFLSGGETMEPLLKTPGQKTDKDETSTFHTKHKKIIDELGEDLDRAFGENDAQQQDPISSQDITRKTVIREKAYNEISSIFGSAAALVSQTGSIFNEVGKTTSLFVQPEAKEDNSKAGLLHKAAELRDIPFLVHFTRLRNLRSICEYGLLSTDALNKDSIIYACNDYARYDERTAAISLSIAHPNDRMFYKYRCENPAEDWVVLVLEADIIWQQEVAFSWHNAADRRIRNLPLEDLQTVSAFERMFAEQLGDIRREGYNLESFDPTDVQAEVMLLNEISSQYIKTLVFPTEKLVHAYRDCVEGRRVRIDNNGQGFFGARSFARRRKALH